jgi:hypothetical protein
MCAEPLHLQCRPPPVRSHLHLLKEADSEHCDFYKSAWYFAWLLVQRRVQCKSILLVKKVIDDDTCDLCRSGPETVNHIPLHGSSGVGSAHRRPPLNTCGTLLYRRPLRRHTGPASCYSAAASYGNTETVWCSSLTHPLPRIRPSLAMSPKDRRSSATYLMPGVPFFAVPHVIY